VNEQHPHARHRSTGPLKFAFRVPWTAGRPGREHATEMLAEQHPARYMEPIGFQAIARGRKNWVEAQAQL